MDDLIKAQMDQSFPTTHKLLNDSAVRFNAQQDHIHTVIQLQHSLDRQLVGAEAAANLQRDALSSDILQSRSAAGQPGNAPSGATA